MARTQALGAGLSPMPYTGSAQSPMHDTGSSLSPMDSPRAATSGTLATALRRTRSALVRGGDRAGGLLRLDRLGSGGAGLNGMWRWEPAVRVDASHASVLSRLVFDTGAWHHLDGPDAAGCWKLIPLVRLTPPGHPVFVDQLGMVSNFAEERDDRLPEILTQAGGLWPFWNALTDIDAVTAPFTVQWIEVALRMAHSVAMRLKHELAVPRPADLSPSIEPMIPTPGHGSFPSGHATVGFLFTRLMEHRLGLSAGASIPIMAQRLAHRVAENRVVAGVHFPIDSVAGRILGETLADYFVARSSGGNFSRDASFDGSVAGALQSLVDEPASLAGQTGCRVGSAVPAGPPDPLLSWLWQRSGEELDGLGLI